MTVWHATIGGWRKSSSRTVKHPSALPGVEVPGKASWRSFRRDWKDDDLMEVCEALGHLTQVGAGQAAGVELGGASRDSTGCGIIQEGLISC